MGDRSKWGLEGEKMGFQAVVKRVTWLENVVG